MEYSIIWNTATCKISRHHKAWICKRSAKGSEECKDSGSMGKVKESEVEICKVSFKSRAWTNRCSSCSRCNKCKAWWLEVEASRQHPKAHWTFLRISSILEFQDMARWDLLWDLQQTQGLVLVNKLRAQDRRYPNLAKWRRWVRWGSSLCRVEFQ